MYVRYANLSIKSSKKQKPYIDAFKSMLESGIFIMGKDVEAFEQNIVNYTKAKYCVGVSSGTDALILALKAYDISFDDEVIIPDMSFIATANAVSFIGAKPVFCDIDNDFNINPNKIENLITKKTKAIIAVHYGGKIAKMDKINKIAKKYNLIVIEDASQAFGATYKNKMAGTIGDIGCFSLNPMKPLGALGEAGIITTSSKTIYEKLKALRYNGLDDNKRCIYKSFNGKIDTLQAVFLNLKLQNLSNTILTREKYIRYYNKHLKKYVIVPKLSKKRQDAYFTYTILVDKHLRDKLVQYLVDNNIEVKINHTSMHKEPAYNISTNRLKNSLKISQMKLALPCHENLTFKEIKYVVKTIKRFFSEL